MGNEENRNLSRVFQTQSGQSPAQTENRVRKPVRTSKFNFRTLSDEEAYVTEWVESGGEYSREEMVSAAAALFEHLLQRAFAAGADPDSQILVGVPVAYSGLRAKAPRVCAGESA